MPTLATPIPLFAPVSAAASALRRRRVQSGRALLAAAVFTWPALLAPSAVSAQGQASPPTAAPAAAAAPEKPADTKPAAEAKPAEAPPAPEPPPLPRIDAIGTMLEVVPLSADEAKALEGAGVYAGLVATLVAPEGKAGAEKARRLLGEGLRTLAGEGASAAMLAVRVEAALDPKAPQTRTTLALTPLVIAAFSGKKIDADIAAPTRQLAPYAYVGDRPGVTARLELWISRKGNPGFAALRTAARAAIAAAGVGYPVNTLSLADIIKKQATAETGLAKLLPEHQAEPVVGFGLQPLSDRLQKLRWAPAGNGNGETIALDIAFSGRASLISAAEENGHPLIDPDRFAILWTPMSATAKQNIDVQFKAKDWKRADPRWKDLDKDGLKEMCGKVRDELFGTLGLSPHDAAAAWWALLQEQYEAVKAADYRAAECESPTLAYGLERIGYIVSFTDGTGSGGARAKEPRQLDIFEVHASVRDADASTDAARPNGGAGAVAGAIDSRPKVQGQDPSAPLPVYNLVNVGPADSRNIKSVELHPEAASPKAPPPVPTVEGGMAPVIDMSTPGAMEALLPAPEQEVSSFELSERKAGNGTATGASAAGTAAPASGGVAPAFPPFDTTGVGAEAKPAPTGTPSAPPPPAPPPPAPLPAAAASPAAAPPAASPAPVAAPQAPAASGAPAEDPGADDKVPAPAAAGDEEAMSTSGDAVRTHLRASDARSLSTAEIGKAMETVLKALGGGTLAPALPSLAATIDLSDSVGLFGGGGHSGPIEAAALEQRGMTAPLETFGCYHNVAGVSGNARAALAKRRGLKEALSIAILTEPVAGAAPRVIALSIRPAAKATLDRVRAGREGKGCGSGGWKPWE